MGPCVSIFLSLPIFLVSCVSCSPPISFLHLEHWRKLAALLFFFFALPSLTLPHHPIPLFQFFPFFPNPVSPPRPMRRRPEESDRLL
ncbi:hypothetical protein F5X96DRAFT_630672 [Biscogniauxia mediterranea]|nr:hypothetical protein F5X96DRAFT_630672 [Biscogniauxia mediterranea]